MIGRKFIFGLLLMLLVLLTGCSVPTERQLQGDWQEDGGTITLHFHDDDILIQGAQVGELPISLYGNYDLIGSSQIELTFEEGNWRGITSGIYEFRLEGNQLTIGERRFNSVD